MVGSTFGVAIMGALVTTIGRSQLDSSLPHVPAATRAAIANSLGSGADLSGHHIAPQIVSASREAFVSALGTGLTVGAAVTLLGAVVAWILIEPRRKQVAPETVEAAAEAAAPQPRGEPDRAEVAV
jgi:hypothetical protein